MGIGRAARSRGAGPQGTGLGRCASSRPWRCCSRQRRWPKPRRPPAAATSASAVKPASAPVADANAIRVLLAPEVETTLVAQMAGRIEVLNASLGQPVVKGKLLVGIECGESQARLRMAEAELAAARDTLTGKTGLKQLNAAGDLEVSTAQAAVDKAKGAVSLGRSQVAYCSLNAPFNGRIARIYVKQHQGVNAGAPLLDLVSDGPLKLRLNVPSLYLRQLKVGHQHSTWPSMKPARPIRPR